MLVLIPNYLIMRKIKLLFIIFLLLNYSSILSAQEKINITFRAPSDIDSSRLSIRLLDFGNVFPIEDKIPKEGLNYSRTVRGSQPKIQIVDRKTDSVYVVLLKKGEGEINLYKDSNRDVLHIKSSDSLVVLGKNRIYKDLFSNRHKNPNIKELGMLFSMDLKKIDKSDSLYNRLLLMLKDLYTEELETLKKYSSDYIAFDFFKDQVLIFQSIFFKQDTSVTNRFKDYMVSTFSEEIQATPEFKKTYRQLSNTDLKKTDSQRIDMYRAREDYLGNSYKISDIKSKYILIDFWATWCGPCMMQIPYIKKLREEFQSEDLEIIGISADYSLNNLKKGILDNEMNWKHIYDENRSVAEEFNVTAYPTVFLIDNSGNILWSGEGFSKNKLDKVREILLQN